MTSPVKQVDREAAADIVKWQQNATAEWEQNNGPAWQFFAAGFSRAIRQGIWDEHPLVQAFARHRENETRELRDALEKAIGWFDGYAQEHYAKARNAPDYREQHGREVKGKTNAERANVLRAALHKGQTDE